MAVLEKIRVRFGLLASIIIAIGLLLFIVDPSSVASALQNMSSKNDVGKINGKTISYPAFQQEVQKFTTINEILTGRSPQGANQQAEIREAAWRELINKYLFIEEAQKAGVEVGEDEMLDLVSGKNISPLIMNNPMFRDNNGEFSKQALLKFIQSRSSDASGRYSLYWDMLQNNVRTSTYYEKYNVLYTSSMFNNPLFQSMNISENNTTSDIAFVLKPFEYSTLNYNRDSSIGEITNSEVKKYYESHKKLYKQDESRELEYVVFEVKPSAKDIEESESLLASLQPKFEETSNVKNFLLRNSDKPYVDYWYKKGDLNRYSMELDKFVWEAKDGEVSTLISKNNVLYLAKLLGTKTLSDSVYVKHILLSGETAKQKADSLLTVLKKGADFAKLATEHSLDTQSAFDGERGSIGWLTANYMIPGFQEIFSKPLNTPFVLETQYGTHVVLLSKATKPVLKKNVAILVKEINPSKETFSEVYARANNFASLAKSSLESYNKAVDSLNVYSHRTGKILLSNNKLGAIDNTKEITRWAFENEKGAVSDIKTIENKYFIISAITATHEEGFTPLEEVKESIKNMLYVQKYRAAQTQKIAEQVKGLSDLEAIAEKLSTTVNTKDAVSFSSMANQNLDNALIGAVSSAQVDKLLGPVEGVLGVYFFKVLKRDVAGFYTDSDAKNEQAGLKYTNLNRIVPFMMQETDVKDNRARFY